MPSFKHFTDLNLVGCESTLDHTTRDITDHCRDITDHWGTIACKPPPVIVSSAYLSSIEEKVSWVSCLHFYFFFHAKTT